MISARKARKLTTTLDTRLFAQELSIIHDLITNRANLGQTSAIYSLENKNPKLVEKLLTKLRSSGFKLIRAPKILTISWKDE